MNFKENDKVIDKNGVVGIVVDLDENNKGYEIGVLFEGEEDNGTWWCNKNDLKMVEQWKRELTKLGKILELEYI